MACPGAYGDPSGGAAMKLRTWTAFMIDALKRLVRGGATATGPVPDVPVFPDSVPGAPHLASYQTAVALWKRGDLNGATRALQSAIEARHDFAEAHLLLGVIYRKQRCWEDAADCFVLANCFDPGLAEAHFNLGTLALEQGAADQAQRSFEKALDARPAYADAHASLGKLMLDRGEVDTAFQHFQRAIEIDPQHVVAHSNLGYVLLKGYYRPDDALRALDIALCLNPQLADAHCNRGMVLQYLGRCEEAIAECDRALELAPGLVQAQVNRALALLTMGDYANGWRAYEARKKWHGSLQRPFPYPEWGGGSLAGKTLLVCAEQGLGDEIMFASCLPEVIARAGHCVIECHRRLEMLFARAYPAATVIGADQAATDLSWVKRAPPIDYKIAIGSLPLYFRNSPEAFPRHAGYLKADPQRIRHWRERLAAQGAGLRVGLSWRGGTRDSNQIRRSLSLVELLPLLRVAGAHFISLQYTDCAAEIAALRGEHDALVHHWPEAIDDYDETAALVAALDVVISVQTAVVHLSGALNTAVWAMVPAAPEWRYQRQGEALPWYPSLRMFRQRTLGDWQSVIDQVTAELRRIANS